MFWKAIIKAVLSALFGYAKDRAETRRKEEAIADQATATERAGQALEGAAVAGAMAEAAVNTGPAETALEGGSFFLDPALPPRAKPAPRAKKPGSAPPRKGGRK
jgi:hypothetical protein